MNIIQGINIQNRFGASSPSKAGISKIAGIGALRFSGVDKLEKTEGVMETQPPERIKSFFEKGTPFFFLHGTTANGRSLNPLVDWVKNESNNEHPAYVSYIPEIQDATGLAEDSEGYYAAYKHALRDMGDFTYQLVNLQMKKLQTVLEETVKLGNPAETTRILGEHFEILPADRDWMVPIIVKNLIEPALKSPDEVDSTGLCLSKLAEYGVSKVEAEVAKLELSPRHKEREIFDTGLLRTLANRQGVELNTNMDVVEPDQVNMRVINFQDIIKMESYLAFISDKLTGALCDALSAREPNLAPEIVEKSAHSITDKLMQKIAPRGMTFGHSQGGTALLLASLLTMENSKKPRQEQVQSIEAAGRFMGFSMLFNAPTMGLKEDHPIGEVVRDELDKVPFLKDRSDGIYKRVRAFGWQTQERNRPAVKEMRRGSPMMKRIQELLPQVEEYADKNGFSIASVWDRDDIYVEKDASELKIKKWARRNEDVPNIFNIELLATQIHPRYSSAEDLVEKMGGTSKIGSWIKRRLPNSMKEYAYDIYTKRLVGLEKHGALLNLPDYVSMALGKKMLDEPASGKGKSNLVQALEPSSFEPFRTQSIRARHNILNKHRETKNTAEVAEVLDQFLKGFSGYLTALVKNAEIRSPLENSASWQAALLLEDTLDTLDEITQDEALRKKYSQTLKTCLQEIGQSQVSYSTRADGTDMNARAALLLLRLVNPAG